VTLASLKIKCINCKNIMKIDEEVLSCPSCNKKYVINDGIIFIKNKEEHYYSEYSPDSDKQKYIPYTINKINKLPELIKIIRTEFPEIANYIFSPKRADFLYLLPDFTIDNNTIFLDVGAGFGNNLIFKKDDIKIGYGIEPTFERILFLKKWANLENADNIIPIKSDSSNIPFNGDVDVILLNGVLEWIGHFENKNIPIEVMRSQISTLKKCYKSLKQNGVLVIAIENRFSPLFIFNKDHKGTYWTSFMPRYFSNFFMNLLCNRAYNTYTYTYWGYKKMLKKVGFNNIIIYGCLPIYRSPKLVYNLEKNIFHKIPKSILETDHFIKKIYINTIFRMFKNLNLAKFLATSFIIFAFKQKPRLLGDLLYSGKGLGVKIFDFDKRRVITKLRCVYNSEVLYNITKRYKPKSPKLLKLDINRRIYIEKFIDGNSIKKYPTKIFELFKELIENYYLPTSRKVSINSYIKSLKNDDIPQIETLRKFIIIANVHGDLHTENVIINNKNEVIIFDWEACRTSSILYDFFTFFSWMHIKKEVKLANILNDAPQNTYEKIAIKILKLFNSTFKINSLDFILTYFNLFIYERINYENKVQINNPYILKNTNLWRNLKNEVYSSLAFYGD